LIYWAEKTFLANGGGGTFLTIQWIRIPCVRPWHRRIEGTLRSGQEARSDPLEGSEFFEIRKFQKLNRESRQSPTGKTGIVGSSSVRVLTAVETGGGEDRRRRSVLRTLRAGRTPSSPYWTT